MSTMTKAVAMSSQQDTINQKLHQLGKDAMSMLDVAEQDAKSGETLCLDKSPHECLVVQFAAPLFVHPHVLLATLNLDKEKFKFDISKHLAMRLPELSYKSLMLSLNEDRDLLSDKDLYIDLREHLQPRDIATLVYTLARLNGIIGVRVLKIFKMDYASVKVARMLGSAVPLLHPVLVWHAASNQYLPPLLSPVHITVALAIAG